MFIGLVGAVGHQFENSTVSSEVVPHTDFSHFFSVPLVWSHPFSSPPAWSNICSYLSDLLLFTPFLCLLCIMSLPYLVQLQCLSGRSHVTAPSCSLPWQPQPARGAGTCNEQGLWWTGAFGAQLTAHGRWCASSSLLENFEKLCHAGLGSNSSI